tara:strand:- start:34 stop:576 length:543 start_codon:yes stop_codon:yes gene_type:complete
MMIKGSKVGLRAVEKEDLDQLKDWRNIPEFRKNFRETKELSSEHQNLWFESLQKTQAINFMFVIERLSDNELLGAAGLLYTNWAIRSADVSFYIGYEKKYIDEEGYAEDAAKVLFDYGFNELNLNKVWMELYEYDSKKLDFFKNKFKFKEDGKLRENCFYEGRYWDSFILSLLKKEFNES